MQQNEGLSTGKKVIILSLLSVLVVLLLVVAIVLPSGTKIRKVSSRTVMIYVAGSDLETKNGLVSDDLARIMPDAIDLNKTKVLLYTGGTLRWHNFISPDEEAIYELTNTGFVKLQSFSQNNISSDSALAQFLNYSYNYTKTDAYDLIFYNHGLGALGSISDEISKDFLDLTEMRMAFERSPFNENNKLESVIFRTCLNSTLEVASTLSPYADYMVASEEVTYGAPGNGVLNFLNDVTVDNNVIEYSETFITAYQDQLTNMGIYGSTHSSYAIVDLSKIPELNNKLDSFFSKIDVNKNYADIVRKRADMYRYGDINGSAYYDTVDLYELIDNLSEYDNSGAQKIKDYLQNEVIVYNWSTTDHSNGLSIYMPFSSSSDIKQAHFTYYDRFYLSSEYKKFISSFTKAQTSTKYTYSYDLSQNKITQKGNEFKLKLTDEQIKNYATSWYIIFKKNEDGTFTNIYIGGDSELDDKGYITTNITNNLITIVSKDGTRVFPIVYQAESAYSKKYKEYIVPLTLIKRNEDGLPEMSNADVHLKVDKNNQVHVGETLLLNKDDSIYKASGVNVDLKDYRAHDYYLFRYNILDENGNYTSNWSSTGTLYMWEETDYDYKFELSSVDENDDIYCVFVVKDIQNNKYYSPLMSLKGGN